MRPWTRLCELLFPAVLLADPHRSFSIGDPDNAILHVAAVLDPVSEAAQRASFLLQTLSRMEGIAISVHLAPVPLMTEVSAASLRGVPRLTAISYHSSASTASHWLRSSSSMSMGTVPLDNLQSYRF